MEKQDIEAIVDVIAGRLSWAGTGRERANKSDARAIISTHALLPEAIVAYKTATGQCGYHEAVKVARKLRDLGNVEAAVNAVVTPAAKKKADHDTRFASAIKSYFTALQNGSVASCHTIIEADSEV